MDEETIMYLALSGVVVLLMLFFIGGYGPFKIAVVILAIIALLIIALINFADFLVFPLFTSILNIKIIPAKDCYIPKKQNCTIKNISGLYYATGYLTANVYSYAFSAEKIEETEDMQLVSAPEKWERILMNISFPFKFSTITFAHELQEYREGLEGKRGFLEFQLSKEMNGSNPSQMAIDDFQRRINVLQARIDRISSGERPVGSLMYIETTAVGVSEKAAMDALDNQLNQLQTAFNALDLQISRVVGRELYLLFNFNYALPITTGEMTKLFEEQR